MRKFNPKKLSIPIKSPEPLVKNNMSIEYPDPQNVCAYQHTILEYL